MNKKGIVERITELFSETRKYFEIQIDIAKLDFAERFVLISSFLLTLLTVILIAIVIMVFLSFSLAYYLAEIMESKPLGFLTVGGVYFVLGIIVISIRKTIITRPILHYMLKTIFKVDNQKKDD